MRPRDPILHTVQIIHLILYAALWLLVMIGGGVIALLLIQEGYYSPSLVLGAGVVMIGARIVELFEDLVS